MTSILKSGAAALAVALDQGRKPKERIAALKEANDCRSKAKVGWSKLGAPEGFNMAAYSDDLLALKKASAGEAGASKEPKKPADPNRGGIGRLVNLLLTTTELGYAEIEAKVKADFPEARTTARSIASVAADLRRDGVEVRSRRRVAAAK